MAWELLLLKLKDSPVRKGPPDVFNLLPLVDHGDLSTAIDAVLPDVRWERDYGALTIGDCHLGFGIASRDALSIMVFVTGGGDPLTPIVALCRANGWAAFDTTTAEFISLDSPSPKGWEEFKAFRDVVARRLRRKTGNGTS